jgi:hypothetical protein
MRMHDYEIGQTMGQGEGDQQAGIEMMLEWMRHR